MKRKQIVLASRPRGIPMLVNFRTEEIDLRLIEQDEVLVKPFFISVDPYMRGRMNDSKSYVPPFELDKPIEGGVVAAVVESNSAAFKVGDKVIGTLPWATLCIEKAERLRKVDTENVDAAYYLGVLGMPGLAAYFGLMDIGNPKAGETVVVSGAAGAVGIVVGQIAKIQGCRVIGIAGTDEKCSMLKTEFRYDEAINYKTATNIQSIIATLCPNGIDVYFDNVGGDITDAVFENLNLHARIALCGQISLYNEGKAPVGPRILPNILTRRAMIKGFIIGDYKNRFPEGYKQLTQWVIEGKLKYKETILHGFDKLPEAFIGLFTGRNEGKMLVEVE